MTEPATIHIDDLRAALESLGIPAGDDLPTVVIHAGTVTVTRWPLGSRTSTTAVHRIATTERTETR
jgi:hypothetical protein